MLYMEYVVHLNVVIILPPKNVCLKLMTAKNVHVCLKLCVQHVYIITITMPLCCLFQFLQSQEKTSNSQLLETEESLKFSSIIRLKKPTIIILLW